MYLLALALIFLLELAVLVAGGWWGFTLDAGWAARIAAGIGAPVLLATAWGVFGAQKAAVPLPGPAKLAFQAAWFVTGGLLLLLAGRPVHGAALVGLWLLDRVVLALTAPSD
ncbi:YrdB family protein [Micromonospora sp. NBRC 110038]|uniref:YrdB family protein n=1 Tax=Micromonospora sp. NBRC 110038 TaxID=1550034 RepID=UPI001E44CA72|nr:YrdB family protein [Micromonospora sp. NBRC 110038]